MCCPRLLGVLFLPPYPRVLLTFLSFLKTSSHVSFSETLSLMYVRGADLSLLSATTISNRLSITMFPPSSTLIG